MVLRTATAASPGNWSHMATRGPQSTLTESQSVGVEPRTPSFEDSSRLFLHILKSGKSRRKSCLRRKGRLEKTLPLLLVLKNLGLGEYIKPSHFTQEGKGIIKKSKDTHSPCELIIVNVGRTRSDNTNKISVK